MIKFKSKINSCVKMYMLNAKHDKSLSSFNEDDRRNFMIFMAYRFYMSLEKIEVKDLPKEDQVFYKDLQLYEQYINKKAFEAALAILKTKKSSDEVSEEAKKLVVTVEKVMDKKNIKDPDLEKQIKSVKEKKVAVKVKKKKRKPAEPLPRSSYEEDRSLFERFVAPAVDKTFDLVGRMLGC